MPAIDRLVREPLGDFIYSTPGMFEGVRGTATKKAGAAIPAVLRCRAPRVGGASSDLCLTAAPTGRKSATVGWSGGWLVGWGVVAVCKGFYFV